MRGQGHSTPLNCFDILGAKISIFAAHLFNFQIFFMAPLPEICRILQIWGEKASLTLKTSLSNLKTLKNDITYHCLAILEYLCVPSIVLSTSPSQYCTTTFLLSHDLSPSPLPVTVVPVTGDDVVRRDWLVSGQGVVIG